MFNDAFSDCVATVARYIPPPAGAAPGSASHWAAIGKALGTDALGLIAQMALTGDKTAICQKLQALAEQRAGLDVPFTIKAKPVTAPVDKGAVAGLAIGALAVGIGIWLLF